MKFAKVTAPLVNPFMAAVPFWGQTTSDLEFEWIVPKTGLRFLYQRGLNSSVRKDVASNVPGHLIRGVANAHNTSFAHVNSLLMVAPLRVQDRYYRSRVFIGHPYTHLVISNPYRTYSLVIDSDRALLGRTFRCDGRSPTS